MRWSIFIILSLSLACTKKEAAAPVEPEQAAETETAPPSEAPEPMVGIPEDPTAEVPRPKGAPELPEALQTPAPPLDAAPVLEVLERGKEPRQALRWTLKPGAEQKVKLDVGFALDALVVVMRVGEGTYVVSYDLTLRAGKPERDGSMPVSFTVDAASIEEMFIGEKRADRMQAALTAARKITGSYTLGPRGRMSNLEVKLPPDATRTSHDIADNLRWALIQMTPEFPEEPLGQGAKWTVQKGITQRGVHVNQLSTMELVKVDGKRVKLAMKQQQSAAKQSFQEPGLPLTQELTLLSGKADGPLDWNLTELAPRAADLSANVLKAVEQGSNKPDAKSVEVIVQASRALKIDEK